MSLCLTYKICSSNKLISIITAALCFQINHSLVAISFSKSRTYQKSIILAAAHHKKKSFSSHQSSNLKLDISNRSSSSYRFITQSQTPTSIHSIHSSYEQIHLLVNHSRLGIFMTSHVHLYLLCFYLSFSISLSVSYSSNLIFREGCIWIMFIFCR